MNRKKLRRLKCPECEAAQGQFHADGCWRERCPQCGGQWVACDCGDTDLPRVPFIVWPSLCGLCGARYPDMFDVPNDVWQHYVQIAERGKMICKKCWDWLTLTIDGKQYAAQHGDAVALGSAEFLRRHQIGTGRQRPDRAVNRCPA
jgi:hypothetical protein